MTMKSDSVHATNGTTIQFLKRKRKSLQNENILHLFRRNIYSKILYQIIHEFFADACLCKADIKNFAY